MSKTLTETLFDEIRTRDSIISDLTNEKDIALEQFNAAVDALNEAYREIDRLNQPDEAEATEEMVNEMLDICTFEDCEESWDYDTPVPESTVRVDFNETLDSVIAGALVSFDKRSGSLSPGELLQLAELKHRFKPSTK